LDSSRGLLSGTTTNSGSFPLTITITDHSSPPKSVAFHPTLTVTPQLVITTTTLSNATEGVPYIATINTSGGTPPIFFSITQANFPPGLTITQPATGPTSDTLTGTPTLSGIYNFFEAVADSGSPQQTSTQNYTVTVFPQPPTNASNGPVTPTSAGIIWEFSLSSDVVGYNVYRSTQSGGGYILVAPGLPSSAFSYTDSTVVHGTTYFYVVTAIGNNSVESVFSDQVTVSFP
jgi:hypothetical protein